MPKTTGILLVNLGTPAAPTAPAIRRFLREFLSDRRVVALPRWLWWPILYGLILPFRPRALVHKYASVWTSQGSPLLVISREQRAALQAALPEARVGLAMRYGEPSIAQGLAELIGAGVKQLLVLPLYPQYSASTTASVNDAVAAALTRLVSPRRKPGSMLEGLDSGLRRNDDLALSCIDDYHADADYIAALAASVRRHWKSYQRGELLVISFHGLPQRMVEQGDPYASQCETSARLLAEALGLTSEEWRLTYQSRLGRGAWLQPYTDATLRQLAAGGTKTVDVICPGFAADCLETLEEIAQQNRAIFRAAGGQELRYIPALNTTAEHIGALAGLIRRHPQHWPDRKA